MRITPRTQRQEVQVSVAAAVAAEERLLTPPETLEQEEPEEMDTLK